MECGGSLTIADYYIDTDFDGIGNKDCMEQTELDLRGSVLEPVVGTINPRGSARIDHMSLSLSKMTMDVKGDSISSKTWYMLGSQLNATATKNIRVVNPSDPRNNPAVIVFWSEDDFAIKNPKFNHHIAESETNSRYIDKMGLYVRVRQGDVIFRTEVKGGEDANTTDFYATASTIRIKAAGEVILPETKINVDRASNTHGNTHNYDPSRYPHIE